MRRIHKISTAAALAVAMGAALSGTIAAPSAQAQTLHVKAKATVAKPLVGVNLYVNENYSLADVEAWGARDLKYIADDLKLKAVAIDWDYNVPTAIADTVSASPTRTPTIDDITALTKIAKSYGMRIEYRVLFAIDNKDSRDSSIHPKHLDEWLDWLYTTEEPALKLAQNEKVPEFVVGSEMASIDQSPEWAPFFKKAAKIYKGSLSYASYGGHENADGGFFSKSRVLLPTTDLGATAYPSINLSKDADVDSLARAWENYLTKDTSAAILRRTALDEVGIPALDGYYRQPWQWDDLTGTVNQMIQARWFAAACRAVTAEHLRGIYFWSFNLSDNPGKPFKSKVGFLGRADSLNAIRNC